MSSAEQYAEQYDDNINFGQHGVGAIPHERSQRFGYILYKL